MPNKQPLSSITISLPPINPILHSHNKGHWRKKSEAIKTLRAIAKFAVWKQTRTERWKKAEVEYAFFVPDRRPRDEANMVQSQKAAIDGVVDSKLLLRDDWEHLHTRSIRVEINDKKPRVLLRFHCIERVQQKAD